MVSKFFPNIKSCNRGITLIEIIAAVFIITIFSAILVSNFPGILKQFALTRAVYKFAQDVKRVEDMGLSGVLTPNLEVKGYGVYLNTVDANFGNKKYVIYADVNGDHYYDYYVSQENYTCDDLSLPPNKDCILETIDLGTTEKGVTIAVGNIMVDSQLGVSIDFAPPNPNVVLSNITPNNYVKVVFALESDATQTKCVFVNTSGLIGVEGCDYMP